MRRFGTKPESLKKPADPLYIFNQRLFLLIIMVKARIKGYPVGEHRRAAVMENASQLHKACSRIDIKLPGPQSLDHLLKERVKLLAIMATALICEDYPLGLHRREAILENLETIICQAFPKQEFPLYHHLLMAA